MAKFSQVLATGLLLFAIPSLVVLGATATPCPPGTTQTGRSAAGPICRPTKPPTPVKPPNVPPTPTKPPDGTDMAVQCTKKKCKDAAECKKYDSTCKSCDEGVCNK